MLARRLLLLATVMLALTLLATALAPPPSQDGGGGTTTSPTGGAAAPADSDLDAIEVTLDTTQGQRDVEATEGDIVRLVVRSDTDDSIELRGFDLVRTVAPETPAEFEVLADRAGDYPIIALESGNTVGTLRVSSP